MEYKKKLAEWRKKREKMFVLREKGLSYNDIGKMFGVTKQRVYTVLKSKPIDKPKQ